MSDIDTTEAEEPDLDKLARAQFTLQRLRTRRRMALIAFIQFTFGGAAVVIGGLWLPGWAEHIDHMSTFLAIYFTSLAGVVSMYWGIGAYEHNTFGGGYGGGFGGGYSSGFGGYGGPTPSSRPPLVKTPRAAG